MTAGRADSLLEEVRRVALDAADAAVLADELSRADELRMELMQGP